MRMDVARMQMLDESAVDGIGTLMRADRGLRMHAEMQTIEVVDALAGGLIVLPIKVPFWRIRLCMAYRRSTHPTPAINSMIDCLRSSLKSPPARD